MNESETPTSVVGVNTGSPVKSQTSAATGTTSIMQDGYDAIMQIWEAVSESGVADAAGAVAKELAPAAIEAVSAVPVVGAAVGALLKLIIGIQDMCDQSGVNCHNCQLVARRIELWSGSLRRLKDSEHDSPAVLPAIAQLFHLFSVMEQLVRTYNGYCPLRRGLSAKSFKESFDQIDVQVCSHVQAILTHIGAEQLRLWSEQRAATAIMLETDELLVKKLDEIGGKLDDNHVLLRELSHDHKRMLEIRHMQVTAAHIAQSELKHVQQLHDCAICSVFKCKWTTGTVVTAKYYHCSTPHAASDLRREARALLHVRSPYVVNIFGVICNDQEGTATSPHDDVVTGIVTEYVDGVCLTHLLRAECETLTNEQVLRIGLWVARGLLHLHLQGVVHGELRPKNVLLDCKPAEPADSMRRAVLIGFGMSCLGAMSASRTDAASSLRWEAPECRRRGGLVAASDMWNFGMMMVQLVTRTHPLDAVSDAELSTFVHDEERVKSAIEIPEKFAFLRETVNGCCRVDPMYRHSAATVVRNIGYQLDCIENSRKSSLSPVPIIAPAAGLA